MAKIGMGRVNVTMKMGMATFSCVQKFSLVDSMRMQSNKMLQRHISRISLCKHIYACMLCVEILRLKQLSAYILNIYHRLIIQ